MLFLKLNQQSYRVSLHYQDEKHGNKKLTLVRKTQSTVPKLTRQSINLQDGQSI